ncbi:hypothetical protein Q4I28_000314 [Leishmania naiffi]|uniref:Uncharacterized protein n=1 Tax=Leishmania naiffi TaxID=5678 RepID=A0AAW3CAA7_9TRYP
MMDARKSQRKSKRVNPKSTMASIIAAHRAEAQKATGELDKDDPYAPPLIFLLRTDDTKRQAARRQEQLDAQLDALGAFGEFRVCVLDSLQSRHWTRYIDSATAPQRPAPDPAESPSSGGALGTVSMAAAAVRGTTDPVVVPASGAGDAATRPFPVAVDFAGKEGANRAGAVETPAVAAPPRISAGGAAEGATEASKVADDVGGKDEEEWEEVEVVVEEDEEDVEQGDSGSSGTYSAADGNGLDSVHPWKTAAHVGNAAVLSMPTKAALTEAPVEQKNPAMPSTAKRSVNTVWAHVKSKTQAAGSAASATARATAAEVSLGAHDNVGEEGAVDLDNDDAAVSAASSVGPNHVWKTVKEQQSLPDNPDKADDVNIPDALRWSVSEKNDCGRVFLAAAHEFPPVESAAKAAPLRRLTDAEVLASLEELEEFDIDGHLGENANASTPMGTTVPAPAADTPEVGSISERKAAKSPAEEHVMTVAVSVDDSTAAAEEVELKGDEETVGKGCASLYSSRLETPVTPSRSLTEVEEEEEAVCVVGAADVGPTWATSNGDSMTTKAREKDAGEEVVATTAADDNTSSAALTVAAPPPPVPPLKPSITMPVYPQVPSRLYYGAKTVYLSDRAFIELPATANVLVIDHLEWDDAHLNAIDAALEKVDPVAGHVLLYLDAYAPQSEHVMGDMNAYRRSLLPFIFVFRTRLSTEAAMGVQRRLTNALHVRPALNNTAQQALLAGQNDRTTVCVLSAAESERGGENPMLAPEPRKATPASPKPLSVEQAPARMATAEKVAVEPPRAVNAPIRESSTAVAASASGLPRTSPAVVEGKTGNVRTGNAADDAVQRLWDLLNNVSFSASSAQGPSEAATAAPSLQVEAQRSHHGGRDGGSETAADVPVPQHTPMPGASSVRGSADQAGRAYICPVEIATTRITSTSDTGEANKAHVADNTVAADATPSRPPRLAYAPSLLSPEVATPLFNASTTTDKAGGTGSAHREFPATTLPAESAEVHGNAAMIKRGLFNFGAIAFGKDNGYYAAAVTRRRQASGVRWGMTDADDEIDDNHNAADAVDGAMTSSALGNVSDLGLYPVSERAAAAAAEAARSNSGSSGGSPFTDEEIAKIEEEIILAQLRKMEKKEQRSEARRAMRAKASEAKAHVSYKSAASPSSSSPPVSSVCSTTKRSRAGKQQWHRSRSASDSSKVAATVREQEHAEDRLLEDFVSSLLVNNSRSNASKAKRGKGSISSTPSPVVVRSARRTLATAASSVRKGNMH